MPPAKRKRIGESARASTLTGGGSTMVEDGFLGQADPTLLSAVLAEVEDEIAFREGKLSKQAEPPEPHPLTHEEWASRDYVLVQRWRARTMEKFNANPSLIDEMYGHAPIKFICHWCDVYEPRNAGKQDPITGKPLLTRFPFVLFKRQEDLLNFYHACVVEEGNGLVEKSRDMGATWCGVAYSAWMWRFVPGSSIGWGSATANKLDEIGNASSIFEKIRLTIRGLPKIFLPRKFKDDHLMYKRILNADNGATITGDVGDNIGRGGRTRLYFVDEAAYLERPDAVEGALSENTRVRIDISSVSAPGTVFHRTRQAGIEWSPGMRISKDRYNVFLLDWRDHPEKTPAWATQRKKSFEERGLAHVYAREIERNYAAVTEGAIIKPEWVEAAFNLGSKLNYTLEDGTPISMALEAGSNIGGLDIADGGEAANAFTLRKAQTVKVLKTWGARDTGVTTREAIGLCLPYLPCELNFDMLGPGSGVKGEANNLADNGRLPADLVLVPWAGGMKVLQPFERIIPDDPKSLMNKDFYANLKAQAWWNVRQLFYNAFLAVTEYREYKPHELISIDTTDIEITLQHKLRDELCQVQANRSTHTQMKLIIKKADHDRQSPNLADSLVMAYWPLPSVSVDFSMGFGIAAPMIIRAN